MTAGPTMKLRYLVALICLALIAVSIAALFWYVSTRESREPSRLAFKEHCTGCHGDDLRGTPRGADLMAESLRHGSDVDALTESIHDATIHRDVAYQRAAFTPTQTLGLALYISERRQRFPTIADSYREVPEGDRVVASSHYNLRIEKVSALPSRPYSIAPLPDGGVLVAEKTRGLSIVDGQGKQGPLIEGTPRVWGRLLNVSGAWVNWGALLDVELDPDYASSGWIYLSFTDRCQWDCGWPIPVSMVKVVRGRIVANRWVDEETIWSVHRKHYTPVPDGVAAGRLAFDDAGYLYVSVGGKNSYDKLHDLNTPFGKVHRVRKDGLVPEDNPYFEAEGERPESSTIHTVWSYGHRTGQGLDGHPRNGEIWNTEMGPRGGDEVNLISRGGNYGWPLYTNGLDYNGERITIGEDLGLDFPLEDTILPVVDWTPAPAVSNFTFHDGDMFPAWGEDLLVGTLKALTLYRVHTAEGVLVEQEKLITGLGRIRDVAMGPDGSVYLALEHYEEGSLWRISRNDG